MKTKEREPNHIDNLKTAARGTRHYDEQEIDGAINYTVGYRDLQFWIPSKQSWIQAKDIFYVTVQDKELAWSEFWAHWKAYIQKRFGLRYVPIETR
jgi:hypothetical protein